MARELADGMKPSNRRYRARGPDEGSIAFGAGVRGSVTREMYPFIAAPIYIQFVRPPRQPYALDTPTFTFAAIATFAARAPVGGVREIAIAAFVTARMASDVASDYALSEAGRRGRAANARRWLSTLAISEPLRRTFIDLVGATEGEAPGIALALRRVIDVTGGILDPGCSAELERLAKELESQTVART